VKEVEAQAKCGKVTGTRTGVAKPSKFDGTTFWAVFWHQLETIVKHNCWTSPEKSIHLITTLQAQATDVLQRVPKGQTYEETLEALEDRFGDQYLAAIYHSQLKTRTQGVRVSMQECATAVEQLDHYAYPALLKIQLLLEGEKMVNEALRQAF
jgi:hypothetical protein